MAGYAHVFKINPNHEPAGSSKGGQFAPAKSGVASPISDDRIKALGVIHSGQGARSRPAPHKRGILGSLAKIFSDSMF